LTVTASQYVGGGGSMDGLALVPLSALLLVSRRRPARRRAPRRLS
jgi:hypothetical protein